MKSLKEQHAELAALTQIYLLQEHSPSDRLFTEKETHAYFREIALRLQAAPPSAATQTQLREAPRNPPPSTSPVVPPLSIPKDSLKPAVISLALPPQPASPASKIMDTPSVVEPMGVQKPAIGLISSTNQGGDALATFVADTDSKSRTCFTPELPAAYKPADFGDIRKILNERFPSFPLVNTIPDDAEAKKISRIWEAQKGIPQVLILSFDEVSKQAIGLISSTDALKEVTRASSPWLVDEIKPIASKQIDFLNNLCIAFEAYGMSARVINAWELEKEKDWERFLKSQELKLVIAGSFRIDACAELKKHYREDAKKARHFLNAVPLFLIPDIAFYLKEPALKSSLWKALKELIAL